MVKVGDINPKDKKFWPDSPDPGFDPERNRRTIENSIKKYEAMRAKRMKAFRNELSERSHAAAYYLTSRHGANGGNSPERYFGKRYLAYLQGKTIASRIRERLRVVRPDGPVFYDQYGVAINAKKTQ